jgi:hypothetical protein
MNGVHRLGGAIAAVLTVTLVVGCGGGGQEETSAHGKVGLPTSKAVAACFRAAGATAVYQRKEHGVILVDGLVGASGIVSIELTGDREKSAEAIERLETEEASTLEAFEALEGAAVGVFSRGKPAGKRTVFNCLE